LTFVCGARFCFAHALPAEVLGGSSRDRFAQIIISDAPNLFGERVGKAHGGRCCTDLFACLGALGRLDGAYAKAQLMHVDATGAQLFDDRRREQRQLLRPHSARCAHEEHATL
jgi:hypothetical protein